MIKGLFTVVVTPFNEQQELDIDALRHLIRFQIAAGASGIVVLGTTGEAPTLTHEERVRIIRAAKEETKNKVHFMVGTGSYATAKTIQDTLEAKQLGADSVLIVTPYYNRPTQEGIFLHFKAISEAVEIPIMVYNHHGRTGQNIQTDTLLRIASLPGICGVKECSGNMSQIMEVIERIARFKPNFSVMSGDDILTIPCMAMGAHGVLSVIGNLIPLQMQAIVQAMLEGKNAQALALHYQLMPLMRMSVIETNPIPTKAAMQCLGMKVGQCRLPLCDLMEDNEKKLRYLLADPVFKTFIDENLSLYQLHSQELVHG